MIKIGIPSRAACIALAVLMSFAPLAEARRWHDDDRSDQRDDNAPRNYPQPRDQPRSRAYPQQRDYPQPRDYPEPRNYPDQRAAPPRGPGMSLDSAVAQASREGRVLSADEVDGGYRIKVLTPQGRVRVLYFGGGR